MGEFVDRAYLDIDGTTVECISIEDTASHELEPVNTMNTLNRAVGWTGGIPTYELTAAVPRPEDGHVVDWHKLMRDKTEFQAVKLYPGGKSKTFHRCRLQSVAESAESGTRVDATLTIGALDMFTS